MSAKNAANDMSLVDLAILSWETVRCPNCGSTDPTKPNRRNCQICKEAAEDPLLTELVFGNR